MGGRERAGTELSLLKRPRRSRGGTPSGRDGSLGRRCWGRLPEVHVPIPDLTNLREVRHIQPVVRELHQIVIGATRGFQGDPEVLEHLLGLQPVIYFPARPRTACARGCTTARSAAAIARRTGHASGSGWFGSFGRAACEDRASSKWYATRYAAMATLRSARLQLDQKAECLPSFLCRDSSR
jgi:hypothetical protein